MLGLEIGRGRMYEKREVGEGIIFDEAQREVREELLELRDDIVMRRWHERKSRGVGIIFEGVRKVLGWDRRLREQGLGGGFYFHGGVGRGKTMLMDIFYGDVPEDEGKKRFHYHDFMRRVHDEFNGLRQDREEGLAMGLVVDRVLGEGCYVLCLDEMEVLDITDAMIIRRVFEEIMGRCITLVVTSNLPPCDLYKDGLQRELFLPFIGMLEDYVEVMDLGSGYDYRFGREGKDALCFVKGEEDELLRLYESWEGEGEEGVDIGLSSRGRFLKARRRGGRKVWLRFEDVCGDVLGSRDYIKLSREFGKFVIEGVPVMSEARVDRVRRFVMLIDVMYEERVDLAILLLEGLSLEETMSWKGEDRYGLMRARSRLEEMLSGDYGSEN